MPHLVELELSLSPDQQWDPVHFTTLTANAPTQVPAITLLRVKGLGRAENAADFVALFRETLQSLDISYNAPAEPAIERSISIPAVKFPLLASICLEGSNADVISHVKALDPELVPCLSKLSLRWIRNERIMSAAVQELQMAAARHGSLKTIQAYLVARRVWPWGFRQTYAFAQRDVELVDSPELYPVLAMSDTPSFLRRLEAGHAGDQRATAIEMVDRLIEFARDWQERAYAAEDWVSTARLAKALQLLDLEWALHEA
ncbi:hypothetical protein JCM10908_000495 [Rhodotorula pacifica]|uniref:uncharacterized protein n=1 Tax=Rhodotorula pacifica TaxID=1495444 RepID=UPI003171519E